MSAIEHELAVPKIVRLVDNENPLGVSPLALQSARASLENGHHYNYGEELIAVLAEQNNVAPEQVVLANGSSELLDTIARLHLKPNIFTEALASSESFSAFEHVTKLAGAKLIKVATKNNYHQDVERLLECVDLYKTGLIWFANPNNPSGLVAPDSEIRRLLENLPKHIFLVLDEAYRDFLPPERQSQSTEWLDEQPNLIITRSFSKSHGLAGMRIGYALASHEEAEKLRQTKRHLDISSIAIAAALGAIRDHEFVEQTRKVINQGRQQIVDGLSELGIAHIPSETNFITFKVSNPDAVYEALKRTGVIIRKLGAFGLHNHLRVSVGSETDNWTFLQALKIVLNPRYRSLILEPEEALVAN